MNWRNRLTDDLAFHLACCVNSVDCNKSAHHRYFPWKSLEAIHCSGPFRPTWLSTMMETTENTEIGSSIGLHVALQYFSTSCIYIFIIQLNDNHVQKYWTLYLSSARAKRLPSSFEIHKRSPHDNLECHFPWTNRRFLNMYLQHSYQCCIHCPSA